MERMGKLDILWRFFLFHTIPSIRFHTTFLLSLWLEGTSSFCFERISLGLLLLVRYLLLLLFLYGLLCFHSILHDLFCVCACIRSVLA